MAKFLANEHNFGVELVKVSKEIERLISEGGKAKIEITGGATRSLSMNRLWRGFWMPQTAAWMNRQGVMIEIKNQHGVVIHKRPVTADDAHEMFVMHWLGVDAEGSREETAKMDKGRFLFMMDRHSQWAVEKGLLLTYPNDSEYAKLKLLTEQ